MDRQLLRTIAVDAGLRPTEISGSEAETIRAIQRHQNLEPCFRTDKRFTCNERCRFKSDCCALLAEWMR